MNTKTYWQHLKVMPTTCIMLHEIKTKRENFREKGHASFKHID